MEKLMSQKEFIDHILKFNETKDENASISTKGNITISKEILDLKYATHLCISADEIEINENVEFSDMLNSIFLYGLKEGQGELFLSIISKKKNLRSLNCTGTHLKFSGDELWLNNIESMMIEYHEDIQELDFLKKCKRLINLDLINAHKLKEIPLSIFSLNELKCLDIEDSRITQIPKTISELKNLIGLSLNCCVDENIRLIENIPFEITELKKLKWLTIGGYVKNLLNNIPDNNIVEFLLKLETNLKEYD